MNDDKKVDPEDQTSFEVLSLRCNFVAFLTPLYDLKRCPPDAPSGVISPYSYYYLSKRLLGGEVINYLSVFCILYSIFSPAPTREEERERELQSEMILLSFAQLTSTPLMILNDT